MNLLNAAWHWYTTVETTGYWLTRYDGVLAAIAGVAVVVWAGGLIAYQIKVTNVSRTIALNVVQNSFMLAVLGLFPHPLSVRIIISVLLVYYTVDAVVTHRRLGNVDFLARDRDKYPLLTDDYWRDQAWWYRFLAYVNFGIVAVFYVWLLIWPYPIAFLWVCTLLLFAGLQSVLLVLNFAPDDWRPQAAIKNQQNTNTFLQLATAQLDAIWKLLNDKL